MSGPAGRRGRPSNRPSSRSALSITGPLAPLSSVRSRSTNTADREVSAAVDCPATRAPRAPFTAPSTTSCTEMADSVWLGTSATLGHTAQRFAFWPAGSCAHPHYAAKGPEGEPVPSRRLDRARRGTPGNLWSASILLPLFRSVKQLLQICGITICDGAQAPSDPRRRGRARIVLGGRRPSRYRPVQRLGPRRPLGARTFRHARGPWGRPPDRRGRARPRPCLPCAVRARGAGHRCRCTSCGDHRDGPGGNDRHNGQMARACPAGRSFVEPPEAQAHRDRRPIVGSRAPARLRQAGPRSVDPPSPGPRPGERAAVRGADRPGHDARTAIRSRGGR